ncbi:inositol 2-dehydrogenase [Muricauda oceani]|uniref:Inositol 2-dehydrogenase n=1 Tax=Flagellimonas oceani TaxID=2698672 RepID=A0A6G7J3Q9_9FLAO|nr:inositol 2-dehydrogenase [Allomuricauda oceani]MBW8244126.1 inositol 2-dehydrogenase [Allomuricauda oceani]QII45097.1 inositol 2-dehydrogenase [Allomuricauda oceani]
MRNLRIAIAGLGRIGKIHLGNLCQMRGVEVVAAMDPLEEGRQYAKEKNVPCVVSAYKEMLDATAPLDAVIICSPTDTHAEYVEMAVRAGINVFCEKPLDLSLQRVVEVLKVVEESNVKLMLGFNRRFDKEFKKVKELVQNGAVGHPHLVKITSRDPGAPPISYIEKSGGLFLDMTIHDFDVARFVVDKEVEEVYAKGTVLIDKAIGEAGDIDTAVVTLTYTDGTMAVIDNSRKASYGYDQRIEVFGSEGMVQSNNNFMDSHKLYNAEGIHAALPLHFFLERYRDAYMVEVQDFINSLGKGVDVPVNGNDGLQSLKIGLAAIKSLKENRPVRLAEIV